MSGHMRRQKALIVKRIEKLPIEHPANRMYSDKLLSILHNRIKREPVLFVLFNKSKIVGIGHSEDGIARLRSQAMSNRKRRWWDKFTVYAVTDPGYLNDVEALATHIAMHEKIGYRSFAKAKNFTEKVKQDVKAWTATEIRVINRSLKPMEKKYHRTLSRIDAKEKKVRKAYAKRIEKTEDKRRQNSLRKQRDKKIDRLRAERKALAPLRYNIASMQAKIQSFQNIKL